MYAVLCVFPQVQLIHYNQDLYLNYSEAEKSPHGIAIISLFMKVTVQHLHHYTTLIYIL